MFFAIAWHDKQAHRSRGKMTPSIPVRCQPCQTSRLDRVGLHQPAGENLFTGSSPWVSEGPKLNGSEAARRIRELSPQSKILLVSQGSSAEVVQEALSTSADGYVVKTDAGRELLTAVDAVLRGETFVSSGVARYGLTTTSHEKSLKHHPNVRAIPGDAAYVEPGIHADFVSDRGKG